MQSNSHPSGPVSHRVGPIEIAADTAAAGRARAVVQAAGSRTAPAVVDDATLAVSEVVSNVVRHTTCPSLSLEVEAAADGMRVEVADCDGEGTPQVRRSPVEEPGGFGMHILDALCSSWGCRRVNTGKCLWFDVGAVAPYV
jgi:anti-sigma regulatory factor (Ser/Thr protein kinase)